MTKADLRRELFGIKTLIRDALLEEANRNGTESKFYQDVLYIWRKMNKQIYE